MRRRRRRPGRPSGGCSIPRIVDTGTHFGKNDAAVAFLNDRNPEIPVFRKEPPHLRIEAADLLDNGTPNRRRRQHRALCEQRGKVAALLPPDHVFAAEHPQPTRHEGEGWIRVQRRNGLLEKQRIERVVAIQEAQILADRLAHAEVPGRGDAAMRLREHASSRPIVMIDQIAGHCVGRPIVHNHDLVGLIGLLQNAVHRLVEVFTQIEARNDDRYLRLVVGLVRQPVAQERVETKPPGGVPRVRLRLRVGSQCDRLWAADELELGSAEAKLDNVRYPVTKSSRQPNLEPVKASALARGGEVLSVFVRRNAAVRAAIYDQIRLRQGRSADRAATPTRRCSRLRAGRRGPHTADPTPYSPDSVIARSDGRARNSFSRCST